MNDNLSLVLKNASQSGKLEFKGLKLKSLPNLGICLSSDDIYLIDISENNFVSFPDLFIFLNVEIFICSYNYLKHIPSDICKYLFLEKLDLSCNQLMSLNSAICKLKNLKILLLSSNRLMSLPQDIGLLQSLEELDSSSNSLTCLPNEITNLSKLKVLNVRHNKLLEVPKDLYMLPLEHVDLSENQLTFISCEFHLSQFLVTLNLTSNPLKFPPINICNRGLLHIMKYLQSESRFKQDVSVSSKENITFDLMNNNFDESNYIATNHLAESVPEPIDDSIPKSPLFSPKLLKKAKDNEVSVKPTIYRTDSGYNTFVDSVRQEYSTVNDLDASRDSSETLISSPSANNQYRNNRRYSSLSTTNSPSFHRLAAIRKSTKAQDSGKDDSFSCMIESSTESNLMSKPNYINQEGNTSTQCVVMIESRPGSGVDQQCNNNNSSESVNTKRRLADIRKMSAHRSASQGDRQHQSVILSKEQQHSQKQIRTFQKIIEAQLHIQLNSERLAQDMSNGVYLCHLANILLPHCIPTVHTPSPGQKALGKPKCRRNLENFLEACRRNGVSENRLFSLRDALNANPQCLPNMAESVNELIQSIRTSRLNNSKMSLSSVTGDNDIYDWRNILQNAQKSVTLRRASRPEISNSKIFMTPTSTISRTINRKSNYQTLSSNKSERSLTLQKELKFSSEV